MPRRKSQAGVNRRTVEPSTASMVAISIRTGCTGHVAYPGLGLLNDTVVIMDVSMTWLEAFRTHYGVNVDPNLFIVQRAANRDGRKSNTVFAKHALTSKIRELILEYQKMRNPFVVYVMMMNPRNQGRRLSNEDQSSSVDDNDDDDSSESENGSPPNLQPVATAPRPSMSQKMSKTNPVLATMTEKTSAIRRRDLNKSTNNAGSTSRLVNLSPTRRSTSATTPTTLGPVRIGLDSGSANRSAPPRENVGTKRPSTSQLSGPNNQRPRFIEDNFNLPNGSHSRLWDEDEENEDARSDITNASQDSQMEDLADMGITLEDLKLSFCRQAEKNISNAQFLKAKHELEQLKKNHGSRWAKWTTYAPTTANIIRDLFGI